MFGRKAAKIKELQEMRNKLYDENHELRLKIEGPIEELETLKWDNGELKRELKLIKPIINTPGFKPAASEKCEHCKFSYFSDYEGNELLGCIKDVVCGDFVGRTPEDD